MSEDLCFSFVCHAFAERTKKVEKALYHYRYDRKNSTTDLRKGKYGFKQTESFNDMRSYFESYGIYEKLLSYIIHRKFKSYLYTYLHMKTEYKEKFFREVKKLFENFNDEQIDLALFSEKEKKFFLRIRD